MLRHLGILRRHANPWRFLVAKVLVATKACRFFTIQRKGYKLRFFPSNVSLQFWIDPLTCDEDLDFFRAYLRSGDAVVDVGANIGDTALTIAHAVGPTGKVLAIEPHPRVFQYLVDNCHLNDARQIQCINTALGSRAGTTSISDSKRDDMNQLTKGDLSISVRTLDDLARDIGSIALLKVDVEGFEKLVLEGAQQTLGRVECVFFESSVELCKCFSYHPRDLYSLLRSAGFTILRNVARAELTEIDNQYIPAAVENLIAVRQIQVLVDRTGWSLGSGSCAGN
jgi:FkbM family methyltransferase